MNYRNTSDIHDFLPCVTPDQWVKNAIENQDILLLDHANCEKKAASMALSFLFKYSHLSDLCMRMSKIAREELVHFEQVGAILKKKGISYKSISASRYASGLRQGVKSDEVGRLIDLLIIGAIVEARSCERFERIAPNLDSDLMKFYLGLLESERRHFTIYIDFAYKYAKIYSKVSSYVDQRISCFLTLDENLIQKSDSEFRFHSGPVLDDPAF
jgi:tRNA-(ms[2]io[6]A)-hydroxylase